MTERPVISDLSYSKMDLTLDTIAVFALLVIVVMTAYDYPRMPESIPHHFNAAGLPDRWGSKSAALILPAISVIMFAVLTILGRFPHVYNYPWLITESNARAQYALARRLLAAMKAWMLCMFAYIIRVQFLTALGVQRGLGRLFLPVTMLVMMAILIAYFVQAKRAA